MIDNDANIQDKEVDLAAIRERLATTKGREYWRSLDELADTKTFKEFLHREFPNNATEWLDSPSRRRFLKLMSASFALAGLTGCGARNNEQIVPYVRQPEQLVEGKPLFFATAMTLGGVGSGLLVESHEGRPTKVEGNPDHPGSLGATDAFAQASVLGLYDPDRSKVVTKLGQISTWAAFLEEIRGILDGQRNSKGAGIRILSETVVSPTLASQLQSLLKQFPSAKWHRYEPIGNDNALLGAQAAFGSPVNPVYRFKEADVILSLDSDFLGCVPGTTQYVKDFAARRRVADNERGMNRMYAVESTPTGTGMKADHRLPVRAAEIESVARLVASRLGVQVQTGGPATAPEEWVNALVSDLQQHKGSSLVVAGLQQPPAVHALVHAMNDALGNAGKTVVYTDPVEAGPVDQAQSLQQLVSDMRSGKVDLLVILSGDPVYTAPVDIGFEQALHKVPSSVHLGPYGPNNNATSAVTTWHIPEAHYLESWSDTRAFNGAASIAQPLIDPLFGGRTAHEILAAFSDQPDKSGHDIVRDYWRSQIKKVNFDQWWRRVRHDGLIPDTALPPKKVSVSPQLGSRLGAPKAPPAQGYELVFQPDTSVYDGRFANNAWLQELPRPLTKLTWDNAALVSPSLAEKLDLKNEDVVQLSYKGYRLNAPVWILPGQAPDSVTLSLGYGQPKIGQIGAGTGVNAYSLRTAGAPWFDSGLRIVKTSDVYPLVTTQDHHGIEGRDHVRQVAVDEYKKNPEAVRELGEDTDEGNSLYPEYKYEGYAWGMSIDMNACVNCNACVVACQAENNIPVVGKDQVGNGREMHWLRIDTYYTGPDLDNPQTLYQPMLCQQCEKAPCEYVCPVAATVHSSEGLNDMVYNRCVGTRYCSNNCPYKVRRFNWLMYNDKKNALLAMQKNPDVTVRERGVMEKCTYCTQRISQARIHASRENRLIRDGEIVTACQAACPADAIVFGNINDPKSRVVKLKAEKRNYSALGELSTQPRTTYLAALRNPNPQIKTEAGGE